VLQLPGVSEWAADTLGEYGFNQQSVDGQDKAQHGIDPDRFDDRSGRKLPTSVSGKSNSDGWVAFLDDAYSERIRDYRNRFTRCHF
jgi:hypothetical protein